MSKKKKNIKDLLEIINDMLEDVDIKKLKAKAEAYTTKLTDVYAIGLRDELYKLSGEYNALIKIKNIIIDLINEGENNG